MMMVRNPLRLTMKLESEEGAIKSADDADERSVFV
jgi:hypothetical protein